MSRLVYVHDLRRQAGAVNSATPLTDNLQKVEDLGKAFDWENWEPWALDEDHVYDPGGGSPEPLRDMGSAHQSSLNVVADSTWTTVGTVTVADLISGHSGVFVFAQANTTATAAGDTHRLRIRVDGGSVNDVRVGEAKNVAEGLVYAFRASAASHTIDLQAFIAMAAPAFPKAVLDPSILAFVVNR